MDTSLLVGKVALVTGTGPNIGSGLALMLAKYGARVACNDIGAEAANAAVKRIERNGGTAMAVLGDVSDEDQVKEYIQKVLDAWGKIDILINNAGRTLGGGSVLNCELDNWKSQLAVTCTGNFLNTKHVARSMIERGIKGSIVCIASTGGWQGQEANIAYDTVKGGVINFVRAAAMDLAPYAIRVNSFTPTATQIDNPELLAERRAAGLGAVQPGGTGGRRLGTYDFAGMVPLGEQPTPTDYGHVVAFLCSDYARLITGADYRVDGGALAKYWPYTPPTEKAGPLPLIKIDVTEV